MRKLRVLDLFSGIGGFSLGLERTGGFETVAFCEIEEFPRKVLEKHWPDVPCYHDVRELTAERLAADGIGPIDLICGGYPCQPFSTAGRRMGDQDDRHLWPEVHRLLDEFRPAWFIGENVAGHISMGLDQVLSDLEASKYAARTFAIPACAADAPHRRNRVWIVANLHSVGMEGRERQGHQPATGKGGAGGLEINRGGQDVANASGGRRGGKSGGKMELARGSQAPYGEGQANQPLSIRLGGIWATEPELGRVANGVPDRSHRLKGLGNAVVPQIPEIIGNAILESMKEEA